MNVDNGDILARDATAYGDLALTNPLVEKLERRDGLSANEMAALERLLAPPRPIAAGSDIVREGERPKHSTLLLEGFCARYTTVADGARQITQISIPGDFVDLHSFVMKQMDHGVVALTDCVIAAAPHAGLRDVTEAHPHLTRLLWLETVVDGAVHRQWLTAMGRRTALANMAHLLCELYLRLQAVLAADAMTFQLPLTQSVLADVLGLSTVHVNRVVAELRAMELVAWSQTQVRILDWDRLASVGEFDAAYLRLWREPV